MRSLVADPAAGPRRLRRVWLIARVKALAGASGATVDIWVHREARIGRRVRITIESGTSTTVRVDRWSVVEDDVWLHLAGGQLLVGPDCRISRRASIKVGGDIRLDGGNMIGYGSVVHCGDAVTMRTWAICAEHCTIADSTHRHRGPDDGIFHLVEFAPVELGPQSFLAPRVSVGPGTTVGAFTVVGPNSTVGRDLPAGVFASGVPAVVVRALPLDFDATAAVVQPIDPTAAAPPRPHPPIPAF